VVLRALAKIVRLRFALEKFRADAVYHAIRMSDTPWRGNANCR